MVLIFISPQPSDVISSDDLESTMRECRVTAEIARIAHLTVQSEIVGKFVARRTGISCPPCLDHRPIGSH